MDGWMDSYDTHTRGAFVSLLFYYAQYGYVDGRTFGRHRHRHRFHTEEYPPPTLVEHIQMVYTINFPLLTCWARVAVGLYVIMFT